MHLYNFNFHLEALVFYELEASGGVYTVYIIKKIKRVLSLKCVFVCMSVYVHVCVCIHIHLNMCPCVGMCVFKCAKFSICCISFLP